MCKRGFRLEGSTNLCVLYMFQNALCYPRQGIQDATVVFPVNAHHEKNNTVQYLHCQTKSGSQA